MLRMELFFSIAFACTTVLAIAVWHLELRASEKAYNAVQAMVANGADPVRARAAIDGDYAVLIECGKGE